MNFIQQSGLLTGFTIPNLLKATGLFRARYTKALKAVVMIQFVSMVVLLILTSCSSLILNSSNQVETNIRTDFEVVETNPILQPNVFEPIPVNASSSSQNTEVDLRLGYTNRGVNCQFFSETIALVLEKELNLNTTLIRFETEDELFDALTEHKIDLTLCFLDPIDRIQLTKPERLGHIRQIGAYYWADEDKKLQIWTHTYAKTELRNEMPCVYQFLEKISFAEVTLNEKNALAWYQNHANEVRQWLKCTS